MSQGIRDSPDVRQKIKEFDKSFEPQPLKSTKVAKKVSLEGVEGYHDVGGNVGEVDGHGIAGDLDGIE